MDAATFGSAPLSPSGISASRLGVISSYTDQYDLLVADFPKITTPNFIWSRLKHGIEHYITPKGSPVHARACRLAPDKLAIAKAEFDSMEAMGIIRRSSSPWALPLQYIAQKFGGI